MTFQLLKYYPGITCFAECELSHRPWSLLQCICMKLFSTSLILYWLYLLYPGKKKHNPTGMCTASINVISKSREALLCQERKVKSGESDNWAVKPSEVSLLVCDVERNSRPMQWQSSRLPHVCCSAQGDGNALSIIKTWTTEEVTHPSYHLSSSIALFIYRLALYHSNPCILGQRWGVVQRRQG